jgi:hypothetical protein
MAGGRPSQDLSHLKDTIIELYLSSSSCLDISIYLQDEFSIKISRTTLQNRLIEWGIRRNSKNDDSSALRARITVLFFECCLEDNDILYILRKEGYSLNKLGLQRLRKKMGLIRRVSLQSREEADKFLLEHVQKELDKGTIEGLGRGHLYTYFRNSMHLVSR